MESDIIFKRAQPAALFAGLFGAAAALAAIAFVGVRRFRARRQEDCNPGTAAHREGEGPVRSAGPEGMRHKPQRPWTPVDEASDEVIPRERSAVDLLNGPLSQPDRKGAAAKTALANGAACP